ncbi:MAG: thiopurine S-methyltransferase [Methylophilaceae bacterium]|nr:thiopurine S-methyltransferase [Methylophilaceae bacterium]
MQPDFWHERWKNNQIGFHQHAINAHLRRFWPTLGAFPRSRAFVPLCGKSRDMVWLRDQGFEVIGVELSPLAVEAFFAENGLEATVTPRRDLTLYQAPGITLYCGDFFALNPTDLEMVGAVFDRAALIALPPEMRPGYARHMLKLLPPGARILLVTFEYDQREMPGPPFSVSENEVRKLFGDHCEVELLGSFDILAEESRFREKGLTALEEKVYRLTCVQPTI